MRPKQHTHTSLLDLGLHACVLGHVWLFATPWTVTHYIPVHRILQARILAISFSREPSWSRDQNCVSCISHISRQIVLSLSHLGSLGPRFVLHTITSLLRKRTKSQKTVNLQLYFCNVKTLYGTIFNPDSQQDICQQVKELNLATQP